MISDRYVLGLCWKQNVNAQQSTDWEEIPRDNLFCGREYVHRMKRLSLFLNFSIRDF